MCCGPSFAWTGRTAAWLEGVNHFWGHWPSNDIEITVIGTDGARAVIVKMSHTNMEPPQVAKYTFPPSSSFLRRGKKTEQRDKTYHLASVREDEMNGQRVPHVFTALLEKMSQKNISNLYQSRSLSALVPAVNATIDFKVPLLTHKVWLCLAPHYIADLLTTSVWPRRRDAGLLVCLHL